jgi:hypothetical protein
MLTATTTRGQVLQAYAKCAAGITKIAGYQTDAGRAIFIGQAPALSVDDPDCAIAIIPGDAQPIGQRTLGKVSADWPVSIAALARMSSWEDASRAWMLVEAVIGDIVRAIEIDDRTLGGLVPNDIRRGPIRPLEREDGSMTVGAAVIYETPQLTAWGRV